MIRWVINLSLRIKATLLVTLMIALALLISGVISYFQFVIATQAIAHHEVERQADVFAVRTKRSLNLKHAENLQMMIDSVLIDSRVLFAAIYNNTGALIAVGTNEPKAWLNYLISPDKTLHTAIILRRPVKIDNTASLTIKPRASAKVFSSNTYTPSASLSKSHTVKKMAGHVVLAYRLRDLQGWWTAQIQVMAMVTVLVSACAILAVFGLVSRWSQRLANLSKASERIAEGDFDTTLDIGFIQEDEIGALAHAYEKMRKVIRGRDRVLRKFNEILRDEVEQRTSELLLAKDVAEEAAVVLQETNLQLTSEVQERKRSEKALKRTEHRYELVTHATNDGIWEWDLSLSTVYYSPRWKAMLGYDEDEITDDAGEWHIRIHPDDQTGFKKAFQAHVAGETEYFEIEHRVRHKDGSYRWIYSRGVVAQSKYDINSKMVGAITDITVRRNAEESLRQRSLHDDLTGLSNRTQLIDRLNKSIDHAKHTDNYRFAVLFLDLDRFKVINDSLGHAAGDQMLIEFSERLKMSIRASDTLTHAAEGGIARLGGDEFVVVLDKIFEPSDASSVAKRIQRTLDKPFNIASNEVFVTSSIGIVVGNERYHRAEELLRDADMAMYRAKNNGRAKYEIFDEEMHTEALMQLRIENNLRRAVEQKQFELRYQPIVSLNTGQILGFESLVRWQHPTDGLVSPADFIPLAEETGLIIPLGAWVLRQACRDMKKWRDLVGEKRDLTVSVNLSKRQISEVGLLETVCQAMDEADIQPHSLKLEMTESVIMKASETLIPVLEQLRNLGCELHMDDFGTGYSSLSCLQNFPLDVIKIDRAFIVNMANDSHYAAVVNAIVTLAHNLGMKVTAEGIESKSQLSQVLALGCDYGQGYYFDKPMPIEQATELLTRRPQWLD